MAKQQSFSKLNGKVGDYTPSSQKIIFTDALTSLAYHLSFALSTTSIVYRESLVSSVYY